jgi:hypothetical protein
MEAYQHPSRPGTVVLSIAQSPLMRAILSESEFGPELHYDEDMHLGHNASRHIPSLARAPAAAELAWPTGGAEAPAPTAAPCCFHAQRDHADGVRAVLHWCRDPNRRPRYPRGAFTSGGKCSRTAACTTSSSSSPRVSVCSRRGSSAGADLSPDGAVGVR